MFVEINDSYNNQPIWININYIISIAKIDNLYYIRMTSNFIYKVTDIPEMLSQAIGE